MKNKKNIKKLVLKVLMLVGIIGTIAGITYGILYACGFTTVDKFIELRNELGDSLLFWGIIVALQVIQSVFIPISNSLISFPVSMIFADEVWKVFLSSFTGIFIGNVILYFIGRFSGGKLLKFVIGDEEKADKFKGIMKDSKAFYLLGGVIPLIPSDVLNVIAGICKYNAWFVIVATFITRAICVGATCFLAGAIAQNPLWIIPLVILLVVMFVLALFVTKRNLQKHRKSL